MAKMAIAGGSDHYHQFVWYCFAADCQQQRSPRIEHNFLREDNNHTPMAGRYRLDVTSFQLYAAAAGFSLQVVP